jgi:hypothetical protein
MTARRTGVHASILGSGLVLAALALALFPSGAGAAPNDIVIDVTGVVYGNPGDVVDVQDVQVDPALVGATCAGVAVIQNNESVHPNTDLIVATGGTATEFHDVESVSDGVVQGTEQVVLGPMINVSVRLGADGVASGGTMLTFDCQATPPTTTPTTAPPTTAPPTTAPPTTAPPTTAPPTTTPTTAPPTTTPTTAAPTTVTAPPTTSEVGPEVVTGPELPFTGSNATLPLVAVGLALLLVGLVLRRVPRR